MGRVGLGGGRLVRNDLSVCDPVGHRQLGVHIGVRGSDFCGRALQEGCHQAVAPRSQEGTVFWASGCGSFYWISSNPAPPPQDSGNCRKQPSSYSGLTEKAADRCVHIRGEVLVECHCFLQSRH